MIEVELLRWSCVPWKAGGTNPDLAAGNEEWLHGEVVSVDPDVVIPRQPRRGTTRRVREHRWERQHRPAVFQDRFRWAGLGGRTQLSPLHRAHHGTPDATLLIRHQHPRDRTELAEHLQHPAEPVMSCARRHHPPAQGPGEPGHPGDHPQLACAGRRPSGISTSGCHRSKLARQIERAPRRSGGAEQRCGVPAPDPSRSSSHATSRPAP